ncbi:MAG: hypothetical protein QOJ27_1971 [Sphingomonadales bacterium]|nr:hypothetical protein [Sphingomonadales bacterium]
MKTKLLSAASGAVLALGVASSGFAPSPAGAQGYGAAPPPPPYEAPPPGYRPPSNYDMPSKSVLKVCKIAKNFAPGGMFTFYTKPAGQKQSVMVPAGPAPGGFCQIVGIYPKGSEVSLFEYIPKGYRIASISTNPSSAERGQSITEGWVKILLPEGFTEVTILQEGSGFIEICKEGGRAGVGYRFSFEGMNGPQTTDPIPANSCTRAIEVPATNLVVTEVGGQGQMVGGSTLPEGRLVNVDLGGARLTARIDVGEIQYQTLITFKNREERGGY